jgi:hypothetical protein
MMKTITEVIQVSLRLVQVILRRLGPHLGEELLGRDLLLGRVGRRLLGRRLGQPARARCLGGHATSVW